MTRIAILGASSQIAGDLILAFSSAKSAHELYLFARDPERVDAWQKENGISYPCRTYERFGSQPHDLVINFVGVGDPARAKRMGADIFEVTQRFDDLALTSLRQHPSRRYIFMSSGAAYGSSFGSPVDVDTSARYNINSLTPQDFYPIAKLHAECRHRAMPDLAITDVRIFNFFSRTHDPNARFFITDLLRAIRDQTTIDVSPEYMMRDFVIPEDFHHLIECVISTSPENQVYDCYSAAPIDKPTLLDVMKREFGLSYRVGDASVAVNATGAKPCYFSNNHRAERIGYRPSFTSEQGVVREARLLLETLAKSGGSDQAG